MPDRGDRFLSILGGYLLTLPYDLKVLFEAASEQNLERQARELAAGTIIYVLTPNEAAPSDQPHLAYVDDAIILRVALRTVLRLGGDGAAEFAERYPEYYEKLEEELGVLRDYLGGDAIAWMESKTLTMARNVYKGKKVAQYLDDAEAADFLFEESLAFATDYEIDEEAVSRIKRAEAIRQHLHRRMAEEAKRIA